jgi:hypothetical protein
MKIKLLLPLLLSFSFIAHASPGDDIWIDINKLYAGVAAAHKGIKRLENAINSLQDLTKNLQVQINNIPQGKQGERGLQGVKGEKGEPGIYTAGEGITIEGDVIKVTKQTHQIGEEYRGGLVFYVDESGQHGLIASKIDVNEEGIQWRNGAAGNKVTNARGDGIGAGETNTRLIIAQQTIDNQNGFFAALLAANFQVLDDGKTPCKTPIASGSFCYGGWYLPSAFELQLLHKNLHQNNLSCFAPEFYWSSTEASVSNAWLINFSSGEISASSKSNTIGRVRAISRF